MPWVSTIVVAVASGCGPAPEPAVTSPPAAVQGHDHEHHHAHDSHDHEEPGTLAAGIAELASALAAVKAHLAADARAEADDAVHAVGHLLEDLQGLVRTSNLAEDATKAANAALDELFECFGELDSALHGEPGQGPSPAEAHASIAARVDEAIEALRRCVGDETPQEAR